MEISNPYKMKRKYILGVKWNKYNIVHKDLHSVKPLASHFFATSD